MSGESFTISITGDSNDSNLVLASASGVITENTSANLGVLEGKVTALEAKDVVFASDLDKLVVADSSFTLDINNLQEDVVNLKNDSLVLEKMDIQSAISQLSYSWTQFSRFAYQLEPVVNDTTKLRLKWYEANSGSFPTDLIVGSDSWNTWIKNTDNAVMTYDHDVKVNGYSSNPPGIILDSDWAENLDSTKNISEIKKENAIVYNPINRQRYHLDKKNIIKFKEEKWESQKQKFINYNVNNYKVSDIHNDPTHSLYFPNVDISYLDWAEQSVTINNVTGPRYAVQGITTEFTFLMIERGFPFFDGTTIFKHDVKNNEKFNELEKNIEALEMNNKLLKQEVALNRGVMEKTLPIYPLPVTGSFNVLGENSKLGVNAYKEFLNFNGEDGEKIRIVDSKYDSPTLINKVLKKLKYETPLICTLHTDAAKLVIQDNSINATLLMPGVWDQEFYDLSKNPKYTNTSNVVEVYNHRNELNALLKQEALDNSNSVIYTINLSNEYGRDLNERFEELCSLYSIYDLSGETSVVDVSVNIAGGDISNGPIAHVFVHSTTNLEESVKNIITKIKTIKQAHSSKKHIIFLRSFDKFAESTLSKLMENFDNNEIVLNKYSCPRPPFAKSLKNIRVVTPFFLDMNCEFYEFCQFYDTNYLTSNNNISFNNELFNTIILNKIYENVTDDTSFVEINNSAKNFNLTNTDLSAAGFGNPLYNDISGSVLGDNIWVLRYDSNDNLVKKQIHTTQELTNPVGDAMVTLLNDISNVDGFKPHQYEIVPYSKFNYYLPGYLEDLNNNISLALETPITYANGGSEINPIYARFAPITGTPFGLNRTQYNNWFDSCGNKIINDTLKELSFNNINYYDLVTLGPALTGWFKEKWNVIDNSYIDFSANQPIRAFGDFKAVLTNLGATTEGSPASQLLIDLSNGKFNSFEYSTPSIDVGYKFNTQTKATVVYDVSYIEPLGVFNLLLNNDMLNSLEQSDKDHILTCISNNYVLANAKSDSRDASNLEIIDASFTILEVFDTSGEIHDMIESAWNKVLLEKSADFSMVYHSMQNFKV